MVQGPQLAWCMLDPDGTIARASAATGEKDLRKLAEFRTRPLTPGRHHALAVGQGRTRPQASVITSVKRILESVGETMPTEASLRQRGWWNAIVGVIHVTHKAQAGEASWASLGRWTQETEGWSVANVFDAHGSFALRAPIPDYWQQTSGNKTPCSSFPRMNDKAIDAVRSALAPVAAHGRTTSSDEEEGLLQHGIEHSMIDELITFLDTDDREERATDRPIVSRPRGKRRREEREERRVR